MLQLDSSQRGFETHWRLAKQSVQASHLLLPLLLAAKGLIAARVLAAVLKALLMDIGVEAAQEAAGTMIRGSCSCRWPAMPVARVILLLQSLDECICLVPVVGRSNGISWAHSNHNGVQSGFCCFGQHCPSHQSMTCLSH